MNALAPARVTAVSDLSPAQMARKAHDDAVSAAAFALDQVRAQMATMSVDLAEVAQIAALDPVTRALCAGLAGQIDGASSRLNGIHGPL